MESKFHQYSSNSSDNFKDKKKTLMDKFKTYRVRMARQCAVQALYLFEFNQNIPTNSGLNFIEDKAEILDKEIIRKSCDDLFYFYKTTFFSLNTYGIEEKSKKVDEIFAKRLVENAVHRLNKIDLLISTKLKGELTLMRLDSLMRALIRIAITEAIILPETETSIISAEYTEISTKFFTGKMISFANGVIDACIKEIRK